MTDSDTGIPIHHLVGSLHDAAHGMSTWLDAIARCQRTFRAAGIAFYAQRGDGNFDETAVLGIAEEFVDSYKHYYHRRENPWARATALARPGVLRTEEVLEQHTGERGVLRRSGYYADWLAPQGFAHSVSQIISREDDLTIKFALYRSAKEGVFESRELKALTHLQSHLYTATLASIRNAQLRAALHSSQVALERLGQGVLLLRGDGELVYANRAAQQHVERARHLRVKGGKLVATSRVAARRLEDLLANASHASGTRVSATFESASDVRPIAMIVVSDARDAGSIGGREPTFVVLVEGALPLRIALSDSACEAYGLTPAEIRLARGLVEGSSLRKAGTDAGFTYETARWYLKQLFAKTSTRRQIDLIECLRSDLPDG